MTNAHSIKTTLSLAVTQLKAQGFETETAKLEAQMLLQQALNVNRAWLIAHQDENLPPSIDEAYRAKTHHAVIPPSKVFFGSVLKSLRLSCKPSAISFVNISRSRGETKTCPIHAAGSWQSRSSGAIL